MGSSLGLDDPYDTMFVIFIPRVIMRILVGIVLASDDHSRESIGLA